MSEETKVCPFCGENIPINAINCPSCKELLIKENTNPNKVIEVPYEYGGFIELIEKVIIFIKSNTMQKILKILKIILVLGIISCVIWVLGFDYPAVKLNHENFWYGQYLISGILHTLLAILFALILLILK